MSFKFQLLSLGLTSAPVGKVSTITPGGKFSSYITIAKLYSVELINPDFLIRMAESVTVILYPKFFIRTGNKKKLKTLSSCRNQQRDGAVGEALRYKPVGRWFDL